MVYTISTGFAIYFVIWWIALFLTLFYLYSRKKT